MKKWLSLLMVMMLLTLTFAGCSSTNDTPDNDTPTLGDGDKPVVEIEIADYGTITVELYPDEAPITVANFLQLVEDGFYDGLTFHRIITNFMIQGGDPNGDGTGGADEQIKGEFSSNGVDNPLLHTRGAVSMARSGQPDSASSQFFIVHEESSWLDGEYAVFGYVLGDGMDVVDEICETVIPYGGNGEVAAEDQPVITTIRVL